MFWINKKMSSESIHQLIQEFKQAGIQIPTYTDLSLEEIEQEYYRLKGELKQKHAQKGKQSENVDNSVNRDHSE